MTATMRTTCDGPDCANEMAGGWVRCENGWLNLQPDMNSNSLDFCCLGCLAEWVVAKLEKDTDALEGMMNSHA